LETATGRIVKDPKNDIKLMTISKDPKKNPSTLRWFPQNSKQNGSHLQKESWENLEAIPTRKLATTCKNPFEFCY